ncbi:MAG: hypothetical protein A2283_20085 [Lentisphaerae bacterium RIFOXYA12_FULL_48_11]|nr:MAG: hypothetical protein A2283_20085 [Lentisphaerae bacterium RIFOXYA12_FULL_48_11]
MAEKKPRKQEHEEEPPENAERWLLSYADMMTLLVAFFIMMYSMSALNLKKFSAVAIAIRSGFGGETTGGKGKVIAGRNWAIVGSDVPSAASSSGEGGKKKGKQAVEEIIHDQAFLEHLKTQIAYLKLDRTIQPILDVEPNEGNRYSVILSDQIVFEPGKASISEENARLIQHIGGFLTNAPMKIVVEGFSGHFQSNPEFRDSWQLSLERARKVADYLISKVDVNPRRITIMGYGEWKTASRARKLSMTATGEWRPSDDVSPGINNSNDRVTVSVLLK